MKKLLLNVVMLLSVFAANAQTDVTKFLGIPVDGTKMEMLSKLREKGFRTSYEMGEDFLEGIFNGEEVYVAPVMNGNKVRRVAVMYKNPLDETQIKLHFNRLVNQFNNNGKYQAVSDDQKISEDERISYQMTVCKKQYDAGFIQLPYNPNKIVTVLISQQGYNKYHILIFYDNGYNTANGEDL